MRLPKLREQEGVMAWQTYLLGCALRSPRRWRCSLRSWRCPACWRWWAQGRWTPAAAPACPGKPAGASEPRLASPRRSATGTRLAVHQTACHPAQGVARRDRHQAMCFPALFTRLYMKFLVLVVKRTTMAKSLYIFIHVPTQTSCPLQSPRTWNMEGGGGRKKKKKKDCEILKKFFI